MVLKYFVNKGSAGKQKIIDIICSFFGIVIGIIGGWVAISDYSARYYVGPFSEFPLIFVLLMGSVSLSYFVYIFFSLIFKAKVFGSEKAKLSFDTIVVGVVCILYQVYLYTTDRRPKFRAS